MNTLSGKKIEVVQSKSLYKWTKNFKRIQERFYSEKIKIRRILQIEDFVKLNGYKKIFHINEVLLDLELTSTLFVENIDNADLILITDQKFSRYPCRGIIEKIKFYASKSDLYLCLNRHYLNIDNQKIEHNLNENYLQAITQWLKLELENFIVIDMSRDYVDLGKHFTWTCPDRHYLIKRVK